MKHLRSTLAFLVVFLCIQVSTAAAQSPPPAPSDRHLSRTAPERAPVMLQETLHASSVNTVVQLPAIADTYLASERPDENFGGDALFLGYNFFGDRFGAQRILVRFNVDSIPDNARINSAQLRLRLSFASPEGDAPMRTVLRRLASDWDEFGVTWNREPQWASVRDSSFVGTDAQWYAWEIPDLVQGWVDGSFPNYGLELIGDERVQQRERIFYARETNTDYFPQLVVNYDVIKDTAPPAVTVEPLPTYVGRSFTVSWSGADQGDAGLAYYDVQYRVDGGEWVDWRTGVTDTQEEFMGAQNGQTYEFRARGVDQVGNVEAFGDPEATTIVDTLPPTSAVAALPALIEAESFVVQWFGNDGGGAGIRYYDVRYRIDGGPWQLWQSQTTATEATFTPPRDGFYEFEVRAVDNAGRAEPFFNQGEAHVAVDTEAPFVTPRLLLPLVRYRA